ncbi:unnamed protein product, partial [Mesorhabditis belari]|uniref:Uncharacterized protein n=1 Tax=Mesorhabditis belari TaxID=2138241 RepID=A0AAF3ECG9_9BILA
MRPEWLRLSKSVRLLIIFASIIVLLFLLSVDHSSQGTSQNVIAEKSCKCKGETFCFQVENLIGEMFDCSLLKYLKEFHLTESDIANTEIKNFNYKEVVFISYSSSNHFSESRQMLTDFRKKFQNKIIYYDIGLNKGELAELANVCNLEVRQFNFSAYPAHVQTLGTYAFKVMIEAEVSVSYNVFWMADTSLVFQQLPVLQQFYLDVKNGKAPEFMIGQKVAKEIQFTHPGE